MDKWSFCENSKKKIGGSSPRGGVRVDVNVDVEFL